MYVFNNNIFLYIEFIEFWIKKKKLVEMKNIFNIKLKFLEYVLYWVDIMYFIVCILDKLFVLNISIFSFE